MPGRVEEKFLDVMQNIESALVSTYKAYPDMVDYDALDAVNALIRVYQSEVRTRPAPTLKLSPLSQTAFEQVKATCEWRLGRAQPQGLKERLFDSGSAPLTLADMIDCLK